MTNVLVKLRSLDTIKNHMHAAREVLQEAESWSTLESEVTALLSEQAYEKAAERLSEANKSMAVFENTPEYESRRTLMVNLQNQLEASLSSALVSAINTQDVAVLKHFYSIFSNIERESEFRSYYYGSRRAPLVELWNKATLSDCGDPSSEAAGNAEKLVEFLSIFYAQFLLVLNQERVSIGAVFPDPASTLSSFIASVLSSLQPTSSQRLADLVTFYGTNALLELIFALRKTEGMCSVF